MRPFLAWIAAKISTRHQSRQNASTLAAPSVYSALARKASSSLGSSIFPPVNFPSTGATATSVAADRPITPRKSRSAPLPGHCRTAKTSIHTTRRALSAPAHTAATRSPHFAPQQCDANTVAGPVKRRTSGSSAKRQRLWCSVAGLTRNCTTSQVFHFQRSSSKVRRRRKSIWMPNWCSRSAVAAGVGAAAASSCSAKRFRSSSRVMTSAFVMGLSSVPLRQGSSAPLQYLTSCSAGCLRCAVARRSWMSAAKVVAYSSSSSAVMPRSFMVGIWRESRS